MLCGRPCGDSARSPAHRLRSEERTPGSTTRSNCGNPSRHAGPSPPPQGRWFDDLSPLRWTQCSRAKASPFEPTAQASQQHGGTHLRCRHTHQNSSSRAVHAEIRASNRLQFHAQIDLHPHQPLNSLELPCERRIHPTAAHSAAGTGRSKHWKRSPLPSRTARKLLLPRASLRAQDPSHRRPFSSGNGPERALEAITPSIAHSAKTPSPPSLPASAGSFPLPHLTSLPPCG